MPELKDALKAIKDAEAERVAEQQRVETAKVKCIDRLSRIDKAMEATKEVEERPDDLPLKRIALKVQAELEAARRAWENADLLQREAEEEKRQQKEAAHAIAVAKGAARAQKEQESQARKIAEKAGDTGKGLAAMLMAK